MKKLVLKSKEEAVELEVRDAVCNFCGEESATCVKGSLEMEVEVPKLTSRCIRMVDLGDTEWKHLPTKVETVHPFFGDPYDKIVKQEMVSVLKGDIRFSNVYLKDGVETKAVQADICHSCIRQLAKLIEPPTPIITVNSSISPISTLIGDFAGGAAAPTPSKKRANGKKR